MQFKSTKLRLKTCKIYNKFTFNSLNSCLFFLFMLFGNVNSSFALGNEFTCATDVIEQSMITTNPDYAQERAQLEQFTQQYRNGFASRMINMGCQKTADLYEIPVVVHVMHLGESVGTGTNITDVSIQNAIAGTNTYLSYFGIKLVLAKRDPNGNSSNGITRTNCSNVPNYVQYGIDASLNPIGAPDSTVKKLSKWDNTQYVNVWLVNKCVQNADYAIMLGKYQGIVMNANGFVLQTIFATFAHEMGHFMNLHHTFQGSTSTACAPNDDPYNQGDKCADTPPVKQSDCASSSCGAFPNIDNSTKNIMSYCSPNRTIFTPDQKTRVMAALSSEYRWSLVTSPGLIPTNVITEVSVDSIAFEQNIGQPLCNGLLTPQVRFKNYGQTVNSMELLVSINNTDTVFTIFPNLRRGADSLISLITVKIPISGTYNIEVIVRKVNGITDYNLLNNNLCTNADLTVGSITIVTNVNLTGAGTITGAGTFSCNGINDTIRVITNPGFIFQNIKEGNTIVSTVPLYVLPINLSQGNRTFTANFTVATYSINATTNPTNGGTVTGTGTYNYGSNVVITFKSKAGYYLVNVTENGNIISTDSVVPISALAANRTLVGNFALKTFSVITSTNGVGGSVFGGGTVSYGTSTTVSASEFSCYQFSNWTENGTIVSTNKNYTFTVAGNRTLVANFTQKQFLVVTAVNNAVLGTTDGGGTYNCGSNVTISAHVQPGGKWLNWTDDAGTIVSTDSILSITVLSSKTYHANFVQMVTGIKQTTLNEISKIYPNPANTILQLEIQSKQNSSITLNIIDMKGSLLDTKTISTTKGILSTTFDVSKLAAGNYLLNLYDEEGMASYQFVVQ